MTQIKICGITNLQDALMAARLGAEYLGFNFYPASPRCIDPARCAEMIAVLRQEFPAVQCVGIFVNSTVAEIQAILQHCQLHLAQCHGDETPEMLTALGAQAYKAIRSPVLASAAEAAQSIHEFACIHKGQIPAFLLDSSVPGVYGGTGITADWALAESISGQYQFFLAGGLTPENVHVALRQVQPWGVDTASGVETRPGVKDAGKMEDFIAAVRQFDIQQGI